MPVEAANAADFGKLLQNSIDREVWKRRIGLVFFSVCALVCTTFYLWKCQFGVDLTEEANFLLPAWKLFPLGDWPTSELWTGARQSDLFNYFLIRPWLPFSVLILRRSAVLLYAVILFMFVYRAYRGRLGLASSLTFALCLLFDWFLLPTWSANWWARDLLILHHFFLWRSLDRRAKGRPLFGAASNFFLAGLFIGGAVVVYPALAAVPVIGSLLLWVVPKFWGRSIPVKNNLGYLLGLAIPAICLYFSLVPGHLAQVWGQSFSFARFPVVANFIFGRLEFWILLTLVILLSNDAEWAGPLVRITDRVNFRARRFLILAGGLSLALATWRLLSLQNLLALYVALGAVGAVVLLLNAWAAKSPVRLVLVVVGVTAGLTFSLSSNYESLFWAMPLLIVPFVADESLRISFRIRARNIDGILEEGYGHGLLIGLVMTLVVGIGEFQRVHTSHDVVTEACVTKIPSGPLAGLKTSARRARVVGDVAEVIGEKEFILADPDFPGAFFFGRVRSALETGEVDANTKRDRELALIQMAERKRFPDLVIQTKQNPEQWGIAGMEEPATELVTNGPYRQFSNCVRNRTLLSSPEFDAFEVDARKISSCLPHPARVFISRAP